MKKSHSHAWIIEAKVIQKNGRCAVGYKIGDRILFTGSQVKGKMCFSALCSMLPKVYALRYGARLPWLKKSEEATHRCPDLHNGVGFELRRKKLDSVI